MRYRSLVPPAVPILVFTGGTGGSAFLTHLIED